MLTLSLLRHAKSNWDDPTQDDFDRPLTKRGIKAASTIGAWIGEHDLVPDIVLCSTAIRTRATLALMLPELGAQPARITYDDALYLAPADALLDAVRRVDKPAAHVLLIGHNPGLHALALSLVSGGSRADLATLASGFATATLAVIRFDAARWRDVRHAGGQLLHIVTPRRGQ